MLQSRPLLRVLQCRILQRSSVLLHCSTLLQTYKVAPCYNVARCYLVACTGVDGVLHCSMRLYSTVLQWCGQPSLSSDMYWRDCRVVDRASAWIAVQWHDAAQCQCIQRVQPRCVDVPGGSRTGAGERRLAARSPHAAARARWCRRYARWCRRGSAVQQPGVFTGTCHTGPHPTHRRQTVDALLIVRSHDAIVGATIAPTVASCKRRFSRNVLCSVSQSA